MNEKNALKKEMKIDFSEILQTEKIYTQIGDEYFEIVEGVEYTMPLSQAEQLEAMEYQGDDNGSN